MLLEVESVSYKVVPMDQLVSLLTDTDGPCHTVTFHLVSDEHVLAEYVIANHFGTDDPTDDFSCMNADPHV